MHKSMSNYIISTLKLYLKLPNELNKLISTYCLPPVLSLGNKDNVIIWSNYMRFGPMKIIKCNKPLRLNMADPSTLYNSDKDVINIDGDYMSSSKYNINEVYYKTYDEGCDMYIGSYIGGFYMLIMCGYKVNPSRIYIASNLEDICFYALNCYSFESCGILPMYHFVDSDDYNCRYITIEEFMKSNIECYNNMVLTIRNASIEIISRYKFISQRMIEDITRCIYDYRGECSIKNNDINSDSKDQCSNENKDISDDKVYNNDKILPLLANSRISPPLANSRIYGKFPSKYIFTTLTTYNYIFRLYDGTWLTYHHYQGPMYDKLVFYSNLFAIIKENVCYNYFELSQQMMNKGKFC